MMLGRHHAEALRHHQNAERWLDEAATDPESVMHAVIDLAQAMGEMLLVQGRLLEERGGRAA